jgi:hypothetical protein
MERKLNFTQRRVNSVLKQPSAAQEKIVDPERFSRFINTSHIDKKKLWSKVELLIEQGKTPTLGEVIEAVGLENGIAEVVSYYSFLKEKASRTHILKNQSELIPLNRERTSFIEVPYLFFSKSQ